MLYRVFFAGIVAGLIAGAILTAAESARLTPLIEAAELYEAAADRAATGDGHDRAGATAWAPAAGVERTAFTLVANLVIGAGFGLLLSGAIALRQAFAGTAPDLRAGLLWGGAGFAVFALAPALGLPPEPPGAAAASIAAREAWWLGTAAATAAGLATIAFAPHHRWRILGAVLILLPHVIGAPQPPDGASAVPASLAAQFAATSLVTAALFWAVLGGGVGWFHDRLGRRA